MDAILSGLSTGSIRALGMLFVAAIIVGAHNISRDAFEKAPALRPTAIKATGAILGLAALAAYSLGQVRDCGPSDSLSIGCDVVDSVRVATAARWDSFFYFLVLLFIPAWMGAYNGWKRRGGAT